MKYILIGILLLIIILGIFKNRIRDTFVDSQFTRKWNTREIKITNFTINNISKSNTVYEGTNVKLQITGIINLFKAPIYPNYDLVSNHNKYVFSKNTYNQNLDTPGSWAGKKYLTSGSWCDSSKGCLGMAYFIPGSNCGWCNKKNLGETKLFNTNRLYSTGSCRNSKGPITCVDPYRFKYNDGTADKIGEFGSMDLKRCSSWTSQGGGWTYSSQGCTNTVGKPENGGGTKLSLIYTKKFYDKPCSYNSDCSLQGLNPSANKQAGKWMCPGVKKLCTVYCNKNSDCKNAGLKPNVGSSCYKLVDQYCRSLPIWKQYNISWGKSSYGRKLPGLASQNQSKPAWRCYKPDALSADTMNYKGTSSDYATTPELEGVWENCIQTGQIGKWQCPSANSYCKVKCNTVSDCVSAGLTNHTCPSRGSYCQPVSNTSNLVKVPILMSPYIQSYPDKKIQIYIGIKGIGMINIFNSTTYNNITIPSGNNTQSTMSFMAPYKPGTYPVLLGIEFSETPNINYSKLDDNMVLGYLTIKERYKWKSDPWKLCNIPCGGGIKKRDVYCLDKVTQNKINSLNKFECNPHQFYSCINSQSYVTKKSPDINTANECAQSCLKDNNCYGATWNEKEKTCYKSTQNCKLNKQSSNNQYGCKKKQVQPCALNTKPTNVMVCNTQKCPPRPSIFNMNVKIAIANSKSQNYNKSNNYNSSNLSNKILGIRMNHNKFNTLYKDVLVYTGKLSEKLDTNWNIIDAGSKKIDFGLSKAYIYNSTYKIYLSYSNNMGLYGSLNADNKAIWKIRSSKGGPVYYIKHVETGLFLNSTLPDKKKNYVRLKFPPHMYDYGVVRCNDTPQEWIILPPKPELGKQNIDLQSASTICEQNNKQLCSKPELNTFGQIGIKYKNCLWTRTPWKGNIKNYVGYPTSSGKDKYCSWIKTNCGQTDSNGNCISWNQATALPLCCSNQISGGSTLNSYIGKYKCKGFMQLNNQGSKCIDNFIKITKRGKNLVLNGDGGTRNVSAKVNQSGFLDINGIIGSLSSIGPSWSEGKVKSNQIYLKLSNGVWWLRV